MQSCRNFVDERADVELLFYIPRPFGALIALELLQDLGLRIALRLGVVHCTALGWCGIQQVR